MSSGFGDVGARASPRAGFEIALLATLVCLFPESATAQFGRNKLQYEVFDFKIIQTAHFDIYYYPRERQAALNAARMAERSYARLSRILAHEFDERKPIILYASHSQFQQTNALPGFISEGTGGVTEFAKRRVILPFTGSYADFEHVLTHELVHAFQYDVIATGLVSQFDLGAFETPLWFMEGMAEYLSIGELDTQTHAWIRDAVLTGYMRTIPEMSLYSDYLSYRFGQSLFAYIGGKYGDESIGMLLQRTMRIGLDGAVQVTLGITVEQLSAEWLETVRTTYLPDVARHGYPDEVGERRTSHAFRPQSRKAFASYVSPALSPDGKQLVYLSDRGNDLYSFYDLWLASAEDGEIEARLVQSSRTPDFESLRFLNSSAAWSPDGVHVAFVAQSGGRDALYIYDVSKRWVVRRIAVELDGISNPTFSPDGLRIAFTGLHGGISDLYVADVSGERIQQLTDDPYADFHPSWSPDGQYIAIATDRGGDTDFDELFFGNFRIGLYNVGRGDVSLLPFQDEGKNINPAWSPDGEALAFVSDRTGVNNVFIWSRAESRLYQLTDLVTGVTGVTPLSPAISWAADADRLAFTCFEGAGYNVYVTDDPRAIAQVVDSLSRPTLIAGKTDGVGRVRGLGGETTNGQGAPGGTHAINGDDGDDEDTFASRTGNDEDATGSSLSPGTSRTRSFYRVLDGFRPSAETPDTAEAVAESEITVASLMRDAEMGLPDTTVFQQEEYKIKLTPDIIGQPTIGAQVGGFYGGGVYGGSYILMSDILGDHNVLLWAQIAGTLDDANILTEYAYTRERANLSMAFQQFPLYRFWGTTATINEGDATVVEDRFERDVYRVLSTAVAYPLNTFQRIEMSAAGYYVSRDSVINRVMVGLTGTGDRTARRLENMVFAGPSIALVWDDALFGYTGPISGRRYRLEVGRFFGDIVVNNVTVDLRHYINFGGQVTLATRLSAYSRSGPDEDDFRVYWGGPYYLRGYDGGSFSLAECAASAVEVADLATTLCPVRDQLIGSSLLLGSAEFRFPFFNFLDLGVVPLGLPPMGGVLFFDIGTAFNSFSQLAWSRPPGADPWDVRAPLAAVGGGVRINILYNIFRVDYAYPLNRDFRRSGVWSLSFGASF